jgi:tetratricopeptide (TPR) repeat protein
MDRLTTLLEMERDKPDDPFLKYALAMEYISQGKPEEAKVYFEQLVYLYPDYIATYYQYGKLEESAGNNTKATNLYLTGIVKSLAAKDSKTARELQQAIDMMD